MPSRIGTLLDMSLKQLERILYFESYVVVEPGSTDLREKDLISEERYRTLMQDQPSGFKAGIGAEAIRELLRKIRSEEHTSELQSLAYLVCRLLLEKKKTHI